MKVNQFSQTVTPHIEKQSVMLKAASLAPTHKHLWKYRLSTNLRYIMCLCNRVLSVTIRKIPAVRQQIRKLPSRGAKTKKVTSKEETEFDHKLIADS